MTHPWKPLTVSLPEQVDATEKHCQRLQGKKSQRQTRITELQKKMGTMPDGFLLVRVMDGIPVRWDDVRLTVSEKQIIL